MTIMRNRIDRKKKRERERERERNHLDNNNADLQKKVLD